MFVGGTDKEGSKMDRLDNALGFLQMEAAITWVMMKEKPQNLRWLEGYFEGVSAAIISLVGLDPAEEHYLHPAVLEEMFEERAFRGSYCYLDEDGKICRY